MCCIPINQVSKLTQGKLVGVNLEGGKENCFVISVDGKKEKQKSHMNSFDTLEEYIRYEHGDAYEVRCDFCHNKFWNLKKQELIRPNICYSCVESLV